MNCGQGFAFFYAVADAFVKFEADGVVDGVLLFFAAATKGGERGAELFAICAGTKPVAGLGTSSWNGFAGVVGVRP